MTETRKPKDKERKFNPTVLGWTVRIASVCALLALLAVLVAEIAQPNRPTQIGVEPHWDKVRVADTGQILVPAEVVNRGTLPIRALIVEFPRESGEPAQFEIDLLGEAESRTVVVAYDQKPTAMRFRIVSYEAL